jgi:hypothetical protein
MSILGLVFVALPIFLFIAGTPLLLAASSSK